MDKQGVTIFKTNDKLALIHYEQTLFLNLPPACMEPLGMENYQIPSSNIKVSSGYYPWQTYKSYARLGFTNNNGWKPYYHSNVNQWFRVSYTSLFTIFRSIYFTVFNDIHKMLCLNLCH